MLIIIFKLFASVVAFLLFLVTIIGALCIFGVIKNKKFEKVCLKTLPILCYLDLIIAFVATLNLIWVY